jgi:hypothetical protein
MAADDKTIAAKAKSPQASANVRQESGSGYDRYGEKIVGQSALSILKNSV